MNRHPLKIASAKRIAKHRNYLDSVSLDSIFSKKIFWDILELEDEYQSIRDYWESRKEIMANPVIEDSILEKLDDAFNQAKKSRTLRGSYGSEMQAVREKIEGLILNPNGKQEEISSLQSRLNELDTSLDNINPLEIRILGRKSMIPHREIRKVSGCIEKQAKLAIKHIRAQKTGADSDLLFFLKRDRTKEEIDCVAGNHDIEKIRSSAIAELESCYSAMFAAISDGDQVPLLVFFTDVVRGKKSLLDFGIENPGF